VNLEQLQSTLGLGAKPFILRTSDRMLFRKCRRLWKWLSHLQDGRVLRESADYLWFGTGIHYALEDYHGLNLYGHPAIAFMAYVKASELAGILPGTWEEHQQMGVALMSYYADHWLSWRDPHKTYEHNGVPQCEVNGAIDMGTQTHDGRHVFYGFTIDRIVIDEWDRLWVEEYKTAKQLRQQHLDVDDQVTAYCWCAWKLYGLPVAGVIYTQFLKKVPVLPKVLATGKVSTNDKAPTTASMYAKLLKDMYGEVVDAPGPNIACYNKLLSREDSDRDKFIARTRVERNMYQIQSFEAKVRMELEDISNPDLPLYPNPTYLCDYMCPLQAACVAVDDGSDWETVLGVYSRPTEDGLTQREKEQEKWRNLLPEPNEVHMTEPDLMYQQLIQEVDQLEQPTLRPEEAFLEELGQ